MKGSRKLNPEGKRAGSREHQWVFGINPVKETLRGERRVYEVFVVPENVDKISAELERENKKRRIKLSVVEKAFFADFPKGHQGVAARVGHIESFTLDDLFNISNRKDEPPFYLIIDSIEDPGNLGAIIRTAEVGGVHGIILQKRRVASGGTVAKASAGAIEYIPIARVANIKHAIRELQERGVTVYGSDAAAERDYWAVNLKVPLAIVIGSEGKGMRETVKRYCNSIIKIPVRGKVNSLNVSVAAGLLIYETVRQRVSP